MLTNDLMLIKVEGLQKEQILESLGFEIRDGYLYRDGKEVKTHDGSNYAKTEDVIAIMPGSLDVVTDLTELEDYFKEY